MTRPLALPLLLALALLAPRAAAAQEPVPPPAPPAPPPPVPALTLVADRVHPAGKGALVLQGDRFRVRGTLTPAVAAPAQRVHLLLHRDGRQIRTLRVAVLPDGRFSARIRPGRSGRYSVRAYHRPTPELGERRGPKVSVSVVRPALAYGASGPLVRLLQRGLHALHYAVPRHDRFDDATARAVMAYRKVNGMPRAYDADERVVRRVLAGKGAFRVRHPDAGHHVEADLSRQVLALIDGDRVIATYHTSTGAPATPTIIGSFRVYSKTPGTNAKGMVHSNYFIRGYAIHGYYDVPAFNASHGCLRVPLADAWRIYSWLRYGDAVIVYP